VLIWHKWSRICEALHLPIPSKALYDSDASDFPSERTMTWSRRQVDSDHSLSPHFASRRPATSLRGSAASRSIRVLMLLLACTQLHGCEGDESTRLYCSRGQEPFLGTANFSCVDCAQGKYKPSDGSSACWPCPPDSFSSSERAEDMSSGTPSVVPAPFRDPGYSVIAGLAFSRVRSTLFFADDNHQIKAAVIARNGSVSAVVVAGAPAWGSDNGVGTFARFTHPSDLDLTPDGSALIVADTGNQLVRKITLSTYQTTSIGYPGTGGSIDGSDTSSPRCRFYVPTGVRVHRNGSAFVLDSFTSRIRVISPDFTTVKSLRMVEGLAYARRIIFSADYQNLIISSLSGSSEMGANRLTEVRITDSATIKEVGAGDASTVDGDALSAHFNRPLAMDWTTEGALLVGQEGDGALRVVDWESGRVSTLLTASAAAKHLMLGVAALAYVPQIRGRHNRTNGVFVGAATGLFPAWEIKFVQWSAGASACSACPGTAKEPCNRQESPRKEPY